MNDNSLPVPAVSGDEPRVPTGGWTLEEAAAELARQDAEADAPPEPIEEPQAEAEGPLDDASLATPDTDAPALETKEVEAPDSLSAPESGAVTISIDGQEHSVSLDELKAGYQRQADYTRKTQTLAEDRRQLQDERAQYGALLNNLTQSLGPGGVMGEGPPDPSLLDRDPAEYVRQSQRWQAQQQVQGAVAREQERVNAETHAHEDQLLSFAIPEWNAPEARAQGKATVSDYLKSTYATTDEEMAGFVDHRLWQLAHKAMQYDALVSNKDLAQKKLRNVPQMQMPGAAESRQEVDAATVKALRDKFHKSGSIDDAAKLMRYLGG